MCPGDRPRSIGARLPREVGPDLEAERLVERGGDLDWSVVGIVTSCTRSIPSGGLVVTYHLLMVGRSSGPMG